MANEDLNFRLGIEGQDEVQRALKDTNQQLKDTDQTQKESNKTTESAVQKWAMLSAGVGGAVTTFKAATGAVKGIVNAAKNFAAEMERVNGVLNRFDGDISEARRRTNGLVSDLELMQAQAKLLQADVDVTAEQFASLAVAATESSAAMGTDATEALNRFADAIARGGAQQMQKLGIDITDVTDRAERKTVALERLHEKYGDVESSADTLGGELDTLSAIVDNAKLAFFRTADAAIQAGESHEEYNEAASETERQVSKLEQVAVAFTLGLTAMTKGVDAAREAHEEWARSVMGSVELTDKAQRRMALFGERFEQLAPVVNEAGGVTDGMVEIMEELDIKFSDFHASSIPNMVGDLRELAKGVRDVHTPLDAMFNSMLNLSDATDEDSDSKDRNTRRSRSAKTAAEKEQEARQELADTIIQEQKPSVDEMVKAGERELALEQELAAIRRGHENRFRSLTAEADTFTHAISEQQSEFEKLARMAEDRTLALQQSLQEAITGVEQATDSSTAATIRALQRYNEAANDAGRESATMQQAIAASAQATGSEVERSVGGIATNALRTHVDAWVSGEQTIGQAAKAIVKSILDSLVAESIVQAIVMTARGFSLLVPPTINPQGAAMAFASAGLWAAVGGAAGAASSAMGGSGGGAAAGAGAGAGGQGATPEGGSDAGRGSRSGPEQVIVQLNAPNLVMTEGEAGEMMDRAGRAARREGRVAA